MSRRHGGGRVELRRHPLRPPLRNSSLRRREHPQPFQEDQVWHVQLAFTPQSVVERLDTEDVSGGPDEEDIYSRGQTASVVSSLLQTICTTTYLTTT